MAAYSLPQPDLRLGSSNRGFSDPLRYSSQTSLPTAISRIPAPARLEPPDTLPGVSQLLNSPFIPHDHLSGQGEYQSNSQTRSDPFGSVRAHAIGGPPVSADHVSQTSQPWPGTTSNQGSSRDIPPHTEPHRDGLLPESRLYNPRSPTGSFRYTFPRPHVQPIQPISSGQQTTVGYVPQPHEQSDSMTTSRRLQTTTYSTESVPSLSDVANQSHDRLERVPSPQSQSAANSDTVKLQPRLLREDVIPGEGAVWVYEDGSTCPKMIDGEPVKPQWGVTKAGKPRKRLAIACTTCREKKIKCDPATPKCIQCEKFGRNCHYANA